MRKFFLISLSVLALTACSAQTDQTKMTAEKVAPKTDVKAAAQKSDQKVAEPKIKTTELGSGIYVLFGPGGNIGLSIGDDGVYMIDDKFAGNAPEILERVAELTDQPVTYVLNTHLHGDHSGSNVQMKEVGATVMAHDNVRARMQTSYENTTFGRTVEPREAEALPVLTFSETATLHFNGQTVRAIHTPHAHTDGDSIVYFEEANIIHMGDNFFNGLFPFIDMDAGGHMDGMIASHNTALALANETTQIIPGHGPMSSKADLTAARDMLIDIRARVKAQMNEGKSLEAIIAGKPLADMSDYASFIKEDGIITFAYKSIKSPQKSHHKTSH